MEITGNPSPLGTSGNSVQAGASLSQTFDTFLQLLTTQMQNQDPLEPMDSGEFTQQLVQFSGVEQSILTNRNLELMLGMLMANHSAAAVDYIGKQVSAETDGAVLAGGEARWTYELAGNATATAITVMDANGKLVYATTGELTAGTHEFVWNGEDNAGNPLPDGEYTIEVIATGADGAAVDATTSVSGIVDSVEMRDGEPYLVIGQTSVPLSSVVRVNETQAAS